MFRPDLSYLSFELGIYAVALWVLWRRWHQDRFCVLWMLGIMAFTGALEICQIRATHSYYYDRFLIMVGRDPYWFPLPIAVAWGVIAYSVMTLTDRLRCSEWAKPPIDAILALSLDLLLDPIVASNHVAAVPGQLCTQDTVVNGAPGIGMWIWCVPGTPFPAIWGIPIANFFAWAFLPLAVSALTRIALQRWQPRSRGLGFQLGLAGGLAAACLAVVFSGLQAYVWLLTQGVSESLMLAVVTLPGLLLLVRMDARRADGPLPWLAWSFPAFSLAYCVAAYVFAVAPGPDGFLQYLIVALAGSSLALVWVGAGLAPTLRFSKWIALLAGNRALIHPGGV